MAQPGQPTVDTTYLEQIASAVTDGTVALTAAQLAWAIGVGAQAVNTEELPDWELRGRLAVLVLAGVSPAEALVLAGFSPAELLRKIADMIDQSPATAAPDPINPLGLFSGQQPPVPGAVPPPDPTPAASAPTPPPSASASRSARPARPAASGRGKP